MSDTVHITVGHIESPIALILPRPNAPLHSQWQSADAQEAFGVGLVVAAGAAFHGCDGFVVQAVGAGAGFDAAVAFVEAEGDFAGDGLLGFFDEGHEGVHFGAVSESVIHHFGDFG